MISERPDEHDTQVTVTIKRVDGLETTVSKCLLLGAYGPASVDHVAGVAKTLGAEAWLEQGYQKLKAQLDEMEPAERNRAGEQDVRPKSKHERTGCFHPFPCACPDRP